MATTNGQDMQLGADPHQLDALARSLRRGGSDVRQVLRTVDARLADTWWEGADADTFRQAWNGEHRARLGRVADRLDRARHHVTEQAGAQRRTSRH